MDFLTLEMSKGGFQHILVITDHFTRYSQAIPTRSQTAKVTADVLYNHFILHYGFPRRLHSDQGRNFEGQVIKELCEMAGIQKSRTTPYHAMGNGMVERFNRTLLSMLGTLSLDEKKDWKSHVSPLVHAYNSTRHESTSRSPFFLMFGRHPRLPVDMMLDVPNEDPKLSYHSYVQGLRDRLKESYVIATRAAEKARQTQKGQYDVRARGATLEVGDRVLVRILAFEGKHKLADKWEEDPYVVLSQPNDGIPVFVVQREDATGRKRTLHRNHLLPISSLPVSRKQRSKPKVASQETEEVESPEVETGLSSTSESSSEGGFVVITESQSDSGDNDSLAAAVDEESTDADLSDEESTNVDTAEGTDDEVESTDSVGSEVRGGHVVTTSASGVGGATSGCDLSGSFVQSECELPVEREEPTCAVRGKSGQPKSRYNLRTDRKPPKWTQTGEYVMYQCQEKPALIPEFSEWEKRANFLASLAAKHSFMASDAAVCQAILKLVVDA